MSRHAAQRRRPHRPVARRSYRWPTKRPRALVVHHPKSAGRVAVRPLRSAWPPHAGKRLAQLGERTDRISIWAMPSSSTHSAIAAGIMIEPGEGARRVGRLSRFDARQRRAQGARYAVARLVSLFPWEDWRKDRPDDHRHDDHAGAEGVHETRNGCRSGTRRERVRLAFGFEGPAWDEEKVLERYELLYEAGLGGGSQARRPRLSAERSAQPTLGVSMMFDHRRILATAIARLRGKMKYRPVVFELMPPQLHASGIAAHRRGDFRRRAAQAELPPPGGGSGPGRGHRQDGARRPRPAGRTVPFPPRSGERAPRPRIAHGRPAFRLKAKRRAFARRSLQIVRPN